VKQQQIRLFQSNIYKIVLTDELMTFAFGCGNGLFFGTYDAQSQMIQISEDKILAGKYIT
jgi:hypothetical protein